MKVSSFFTRILAAFHRKDGFCKLPEELICVHYQRVPKLPELYLSLVPEPPTSLVEPPVNKSLFRNLRRDAIKEMKELAEEYGFECEL